MIPILYESTETSFTSNGLGRLSDMVSCKVTEQRNGIYEAEFEYPADGIHFDEITEGRIIATSHDESGDIQPFVIYGHETPIDGIVKFYAHHISYRLMGKVVKPFTASTCAGALNQITLNYANPTLDFSFSTDKNVSASFKLSVPKPIRSVLGGEEGSILDVFGSGEYEFDKFNVILHAQRGQTRDLQVRYGKNLRNINTELNYSDAFTGIVPFWYGVDSSSQSEILVTIPEWYLTKVASGYDGQVTLIPKDFSNIIPTRPPYQILRQQAQEWLNNNTPQLPLDNIKFDFIELSQTEDYKDILPLQQVLLCDTIELIFPELGEAGVTMKVITTEWDPLSEKYTSLEVGDAPQTYAEAITDRLAEVNELNMNLAKYAQLWASNALAIANNTDQYFWFTSTGTDTGAHITEVPQDEFTDPGHANYHSGSNLLARSNGIAVRQGLVELATFAAAGAQIGLSTGGHTIVDSSGLHIYGGSDGQTVLANIGYGSGASETGTADAPYYTIGVRKSSTTIGNYSTAEGYNTTASAYCSHAEGYNTTASGLYSHAEGYNTTASGLYSHAEGNGTTASESYSHAEGYETTASGFNSHAEGDGTTSSGRFSHAEGDGTTSSGHFSHAEGRDTIAGGAYSHAEGYETIARGSSSHAQGKYNVEDTEYKFADIIGNGTSSSRSNAMAVDWDGNIYTNGDIYVNCDSDSSNGVKLPIMEGNRGQISSSVDAGSYAEFEYTFSNTYSSTPVVVACLGASFTSASVYATVQISVTDVSTTGFTLRVANSGSASRRPTISWIAVGF